MIQDQHIAISVSARIRPWGQTASQLKCNLQHMTSKTNAHRHKTFLDGGGGAGLGPRPWIRHGAAPAPRSLCASLPAATRGRVLCFEDVMTLRRIPRLKAGALIEGTLDKTSILPAAAFVFLFVFLPLFPNGKRV